MKNIIGKKCTITSKESIFFDEWGIIKGFDGTHYYISIANDSTLEAIFLRSEFKVKRGQEK